jgi:glycosyltransferase involved in cell wall biosynthesis
VLFVALGDNGPPERIGKAEIRFIPRINSPVDVVSYYQASDLYLHAARADTFPRSVLEALACGTPVIATGVGGIPEQINSLNNQSRCNGANATGIIVPRADPRAMAEGIETLLTNDILRQNLSENAIKDVSNRFDLTKQADCYLDWYRDILQFQDAKAPSNNNFAVI